MTTKYLIEGGAWTTCASPITLSSDGVRSLNYCSVDLAGNNEDVKSATVKTDRGRPSADADLQGTPSFSGWHNSSASVTLSATDSVSGVSAIKCRINGGSRQDCAGRLSASADEAYTVEHYAVDKAGNTERSKNYSAELVIGGEG